MLQPPVASDCRSHCFYRAAQAGATGLSRRSGPSHHRAAESVWRSAPHDQDISTGHSALMSKVMANGTGKIKFPINKPAEGRRSGQV